MADYANQQKDGVMVTRNVVLTAQLSAFVNRLVNSGRFQNPSEAQRADVGTVWPRADKPIGAQTLGFVLEGWGGSDGKCQIQVDRLAGDCSLSFDHMVRNRDG